MLGMVKQDGQGNKYLSQIAGATLGQGVPLGAWCSFEKDVAPSNNWLMADTTFDASVYPALNLYLGTNKVPSRYDHNRPSDYESITLSTDSNNPTVMDYDGVLLVKIANSGYNPEIFINNISVGKVGMSSSATGTSLYGNVGTFIFKKGDSIYSNSSDSNITYQVAYYTHPLFIKATSIASDTDQQAILAQIQAYNTYSTEETLTGKTWIDGKPIYRKVVILDNATSWSRDSWGLIPNSANDVPNAEQIVSFSVFALPSGKLAIATHGEAYAESDGIHYYSTVLISLKSYIVEYTKTTD